MSSAILRTATRRSLARPSFLSSGSSRVLRTRSIWVRSRSVGAPAHPSRQGSRHSKSTAATRARRGEPFILSSSSDLAEDVLGDELLEIHRRLDLPDAPVGGDQLVRA